MIGEFLFESAEVTTSQSERALFQLLENGPAKKGEELFATALSKCWPYVSVET